MKWINHVLIAGSVTAVYDVKLVPPTIVGATAPDWMEWVLKFLGRPVKHRTVTHYLSIWALAWIAGLFLLPGNATGTLLTAFCWGGVTHVLTDAMTVSGVPLSPYSDRRFHLFGGRFRTGEPAEYGISAVTVCVCIGLMNLMPSGGWAPFFYDWAGYYESGVIDGYEWRVNRFRIF